MYAPRTSWSWCGRRSDRESAPLRSTLARWVGTTSNLLAPLVDAVQKHVLAGRKLHADDTPIPVLAPRQRQDQNRQALDIRARRLACWGSCCAAVWFRIPSGK